jgi:hypothetical protein
MRSLVAADLAITAENNPFETINGELHLLGTPLRIDNEYEWRFASQVHTDMMTGTLVEMRMRYPRERSVLRFTSGDWAAGILASDFLAIVLLGHEEGVSRGDAGIYLLGQKLNPGARYHWTYSGDFPRETLTEGIFMGLNDDGQLMFTHPDNAIFHFTINPRGLSTMELDAPTPMISSGDSAD